MSPMLCGAPGLSLARSQLSCTIPRMQPLGKARHRNGLRGTVPAVPMCQEPQELPGKGLRLAAGPAACRVLPCALSQELLQGFDKGPQGMGRLWDRGGGAVERVGVISALLSEVRRDR